MSSNSQQIDQVVLVTPQDQVIGSIDKFVAHRHPAQLHRAISVWLHDEQGQLLFQRRSQKKIVGATWWGNTVCGNVWPDESYEACARRRLQVELGIEGVALSPVMKFHYKAYANEAYAEHEIDQLYISTVKRAELIIGVNLDEASEVLWVDKHEYFEKVDEALMAFRLQLGRNYPTVEQTPAMTLDELRKWTPPLTIELAGVSCELVPWTILMSQLPDLRAALSL